MSGNIFTTLTILVAALVLVTGYNVQPLLEQKLINTLMKSGRALGTGRSLECFGIYLPLLNDATANYEAAYEVCLQNTANSKQRIESEVAADRDNVTASGNDICSAYSSCNGSPSSLDFFQCNNKVAGEAIASSHDIQTISKAKAQYILLRVETINYDQNVCTDASSNAYVEETSSLYRQLDACLAGTEVQPATSTSASTSSSTSTSPSTESKYPYV